jgi:hypothetical protein
MTLDTKARDQASGRGVLWNSTAFFDSDAVITKTTTDQSAAWKRIFDE